MARNGKRKGRGCLITLVVLIVLGAAVWFIGMPIVNNQAASYVDSAIQDALQSPGSPPLQYSAIAIDTTKGQVTMSTLDMPLEEGASVRAGKVTLHVEPSELVSFALGRSSGISRAKVDMEQLQFTSAETAVQAEHATVQIRGTIDLNRPEDSVIREAQITAVKAHFVDPESPVAFSADSLELDISGKLTMQTLEKDFSGILDDIAYIDLKASGGALLPDEQTMAQLGMFTMVSPWIANTDNWGFDSIDLQARSLEESVAIDTFALSAPLMDATGKAELPRDGEGPLALSMDIQELNSDVRAELAPIAQFMGQQIPEGSFSFEFDWSGVGMPAFTLR